MCCHAGLLEEEKKGEELILVVAAMYHMDVLWVLQEKVLVVVLLSFSGVNPHHCAHRYHVVKAAECRRVTVGELKDIVQRQQVSGQL